MRVQLLVGATGATVPAGDVHAEQLAADAARDARGAPDDEVVAGGAGQRHDDPLPGLPHLVDAVGLEVRLELVLDPVRDPQQRQLAQRGQVARSEVVGERGVDALRRVHVAVRHPSAQRLGGHVDELDLVGPTHPLVGHGLPLAHPGDALDDVVDGVQVLDVHRGDDVDAGLEQLLDVGEALLVAGPGGVRVGELVDQRDVGPSPQQGVEVHLGDDRAAVLDAAPGQHLEVIQSLPGRSAPVRLDHAHDHICAACPPPCTLVEHRVGLADPRCRAEVDAQLATAHGRRPSSLRLSSRTFTPGSPSTPSGRSSM